jgi:hypothetical protein
MGRGELRKGRIRVECANIEFNQAEIRMEMRGKGSLKGVESIFTIFHDVIYKLLTTPA